MAGKKGSKKSKSPKTPKSGRRPPTAEGSDGEGIKRGLTSTVEIQRPSDKPSDESVKKFGPYSVEAKQARTAILLLRSEEQHIVIESLNALQKFCKKRPENKEIFVELGGPEEAIQLISHAHQVIQRIAMKLLAMSSPIHKTKLLFRDMNLAKDMITLAKSKDEVVQEYATVVLSNLSTLYTGRLQIIQSEGVPLLVELTDHLDPDIQKNSALTLWHIMEESANFSLIATDQNVRTIIKLCDNEYPAVQVVGLNILERITRRAAGIHIVESTDLVNHFAVKIANPDLADIHRVILKILVNMSSSAATCRKLSSMLPRIMSLIDNTKDLKAAVHACTLLGKMASIIMIAHDLVDFGFTKKINDILSTHMDLEIREAAALAAAQLAASDLRAKSQFVAAIGPLVKFFNTEGISSHACENVTLALSIILEETSTSCSAFLEAGGIGLLLEIFNNNANYSDETVLSAMTCVSLISLHWELRNYIVDKGLVSAIIACLDKSNPQLLSLAANAMCGFLCDEQGRKEFMTKQGPLKLIEIVSHSEFPVAASVVPIIHILGADKKMAQELVDNGLLQAIWSRQDLISQNGPFRTAYERLVASHLPAKFGLHGHIDPFEKLENGFYDSGLLRKGERFFTLKELNYETRDPARRILYLNMDTNVDPIVLEANKSLQTIVEEGQTIGVYIDEVSEILKTQNIRSEKALVAVIATVIASKLGGTLDKWRLSAESEDLEVANLQNAYQSVVIPITMLSNGAHRPRALLFKALCDRFGIPSTLDRGGYKKFWNVVLLTARKRVKPPCSCEEGDDLINPPNPVFTEKLRRYVVDLVYQPGTLFPINTYEANAYCFY